MGVVAAGSFGPSSFRLVSALAFALVSVSTLAGSFFAFTALALAELALATLALDLLLCRL